MKISHLVTAVIAACVVTGEASAHHKQQQNLLLLLDGRKNVYECEIPATDRGTTIASCHDHDVINLKTGKVIGTATDSTADVEEIGDGLVATGTTFFRLKHGALTLRGRGTIQPSLVGQPVLDNAPVTHIAGVFPNPGDNQVLEGTGRYAHATGTFALLGALDLSQAAQGIEKFHCVYTIALDLAGNK